MNLLILMCIFYTSNATYYCNMHVVIEDCLFDMWNRDAGIAKSSVTTIINNLNRVYHNTVFQQMDLEFQLEKLSLGSEICSSKDAKLHSKACLHKFSHHSLTNSSLYCLHYLFTYRDFANGHVGLAFPGVVCKDSSVSQAFNVGLITFLNAGWNQSLEMASENLAHEVRFASFTSLTV